LPKGWISKVAFAADGKTLVSAIRRVENGQDVYEVKLWDPATGQEKGSLAGANHRLHGVAISPDGTLVAACSAVISKEGETTGGEVYLWEVATGNLLWQKQEHTDQLNDLVFAPDGKTLA